MYCYQLYICTIQKKNNLGRHHLTSLGDIAEGTTPYFETFKFLNFYVWAHKNWNHKMYAHLTL